MMRHLDIVFRRPTFSIGCAVTASCTILLVSGVSRSALAQSSPFNVPAVTVRSTGTRPASAGEALYHVRYRRSQLEDGVSFRAVDYPIDSMLTVVATTATTWLDHLKQQPIGGVQFEPSGGVGIRAKQEAYAKSQFATRLATSGLSVQERAYTLAAAVATFADWRYPEQLPIAEGYVRDLIALGAPASPWQYRAREVLLNQYFLLGRSADVIRHGTAAIALLPQMSYIQQGEFIDNLYLYGTTVAALTGQPDGRATIATLNATLRATIEPPPGSIAIDSAYSGAETSRRWSVNKAIVKSAMLGTVGKPWIGQYWVNRPTHDSAAIGVADGKIRLVEDFSYRCDGCVVELHSLERLQRRFPGIQAMGVTHTLGFWGNRLAEPVEEARQIEDFLLHKIHLTIPVGIWLSPKVQGDDDGLAPEPSTRPNAANYPKVGKSCIWLLDGHGRIRRIYESAGRDVENDIARMIEFLQREAAVEQHG
jgi:hypothetical protein